MDWKEKIRDLSTSLNNFGSLKKHTKWGGGLRPPPHFVCFFCSQNSSNCCLRSRIFPFNPFWLAGANQKITFWGPWTYFKLIVIFDFDLNIFIFVIFLGSAAFLIGRPSWSGGLLDRSKPYQETYLLIFRRSERRPAEAFWADKIVFWASKASRRGLSGRQNCIVS